MTLGAALGGQAGDARLEQQPDLEPAQDRVEPQLGDAEAAVGLRVDQALARSGAAAPRAPACGRCPRRSASSTCAEPRARRDVTVEDELADALVGEVHDAVDLEHEQQQ